MKRKIKVKINASLIFGLVIIIVFAFLCVKNADLCYRILCKAANASASTVLTPIYEFKEPITTVPTIDDTTVSAEEVTKNNTPTEPDSTTEAEKTEITDDTFTLVSSDIKKLIEEYEKKSDKDKKDGAIIEQTYKDSGVTDKYDTVRIKNVNDTKINIKNLLNEKADLKITDKSEPTVLIFHTHTTERYQILDRDFYATGYTSRSTNPKENMVRVGDEIVDQLEAAGYTVIHDTTIYDSKYNGAYNRSRESIEKYLKEYPSIQIILDIHRDAIQYNNGTKVKPVADIMGKKAAQIMIISGCQESGNGISGFEDWNYNLIFAAQLQKQLEDMFSGITRPLYFCPRKYNMDTSHCSLLIEIGTDGNTLDEAVFSGRCLGKALSELMKNYTNEG